MCIWNIFQLQNSQFWSFVTFGLQCSINHARCGFMYDKCTFLQPENFTELTGIISLFIFEHFWNVFRAHFLQSFCINKKLPAYRHVTQTAEKGLNVPRQGIYRFEPQAAIRYDNFKFDYPVHGFGNQVTNIFCLQVATS